MKSTFVPEGGLRMKGEHGGGKSWCWRRGGSGTGAGETKPAPADGSVLSEGLG